MLLSDQAIIEGVKFGEIIIDSFDRAYLGPNSYDLRLGNKLLTYNIQGKAEDQFSGENGQGNQRNYLDSRGQNHTSTILIPKSGIVLQPGILYLGSTVERAGSKVYAPMVEGRSSMGRLGVEIHISAGFGDVGFVGHWTLEITVVHPVKIYPGDRICQVYFFETKYKPRKLYSGKYIDQPGIPIASKMFLDDEREKHDQ